MNLMLIVTLVTLTWSVNYGYSAEIVDPGNIFDRFNPIRSIVGAQPYDNAKLNAFTLPSRMIQGMSNIALAPWRGNDFSSRGGKLPRMSNLFSGLPIIGSAFGGRGSRGLGPMVNNYGPMAKVEMARAPGSGPGPAFASASASTSVNLSGQPNGANSGSFTGYPSLPSNFFTSLPMTPAPGQGPSNQASRPSSSPITASVSSPSSGLPSIPTVSSSIMGATSSGSSSTYQLPSLSLGPPSPSLIPTSGSASSSASVPPSVGPGSSGLTDGFNSLLSNPGLGQASNFLSNLFSFPLNG